MQSKTCPVCGNEFGHNFNKERLKRQVCCSVSCRQRYKAKPEKKSTFTCQWCKQPFTEWTYRKPHFCSNQCRSEYAARQPRPNTRKPQNYVALLCEQCGKEYVIHKSVLKDRISRFCSIPCRSEYNSLHMQGINHPRYKGGTEFPNRGSNWVAQRRKARKRDGRCCQICGYIPTSGEKWALDVHHIIPYKEFEGDYQAANDLSNLIVLCRSCHADVEAGRTKCPTPIQKRPKAG